MNVLKDGHSSSNVLLCISEDQEPNGILLSPDAKKVYMYVRSPSPLS